MYFFLRNEFEIIESERYFYSKKYTNKIQCNFGILRSKSVERNYGGAVSNPSSIYTNLKSVSKLVHIDFNFLFCKKKTIHFLIILVHVYDVFCIIGVDAPFKSRLPKSMNFSNALYTIDIGQNDLSFGLMSSDIKSIRSTIPDILSQFSLGLQVMCYCTKFIA